MRLKPFSVPLLGALVGAGCSPAAQPPLSRRQPVAVLIGVAEVVDLAATFEAGGVVRARATAPIASRVMAPVAVVHVSAGDRVRRGAPLVTLDAREMKANSLRAAAALSSAAEAAAAAESDVRAARRDSVAAEMSGTWGGPQTIAGPILIVPYRCVMTENDGRTRQMTWRATFLPEALDVQGVLEPEVRQRSLFRVVVYKAHLMISGRFSRPDLASLTRTTVEPRMPGARGSRDAQPRVYTWRTLAARSDADRPACGGPCRRLSTRQTGRPRPRARSSA